MAEKNFIVWIYHTLFIHSSTDGHLDCFHVLAVVSSAAVNIVVEVSFEPLFSVLPVTHLGGELLGHVVILCLTFEDLNFLLVVLLISRSITLLHNKDR